MITPDSFYSPEEYPDSRAKAKMWRTIQKETNANKRSFILISDYKSFVYGIAAALVVYFASVGVYTTVRETMENSKPQLIRLDEAYQSAIQDFENIVPHVANQSSVEDKTYIDIRKEQIKNIDAAISNFKKEIGGGDLSPLAQKRLRQLYSMKLKVLQDLFDQGELSL